MTGTKQQRSVFQFGVFAFDPHSGELRKHGVRLRLPDQPLQILTLLLERAGQLVTREEIQKRLWPDGTYVDFDHAINSNVRKLRDAIGDSAENPRFIETLARRGYRFIAPVAGNADAHEPAPASAPQALPRPTHWRLYALAAVLATGAITTLLYYRSRPPADAAIRAVPITTFPGFQRFPSFSPDGTRIAFTWKKPGIQAPSLYVKLIGPAEPVELARDAFAPAWSPDGRQIAFLRAHGTFQNSVVLIPALGGRERELASIQFDARQIFFGKTQPTPFLAWSPDSRWLLALDHLAPDRPNSIVRISLETGERHLWPMSLGVRDQSDGYNALAISPDGATLAVIMMQHATNCELFTVPLSQGMLPAGKLVRLTFDGKHIDSLAWAPDSRSLIMSSERRGTPELWRVNFPSLGQPVALPIQSDSVHDVIVSRAGERLLYSHDHQDSNIWRLPLQGIGAFHASELIASTRTDQRPSYSFDGKHIAFESGRSGSEQIWTCDNDCSDPVQLTFFENGWTGSPAWSPDGTQIVFDSDAAGSWDVYRINAFGGRPVRLTQSAKTDMRPVWSRDGKWIYYTSNQSGTPQIWRMLPTGEDKLQITRNSGYNAYQSRDGAYLYYARSEGGLWQVPVNGGEEVSLWPQMDGGKCAPVKQGLYCLDDAGDRATLLAFDLKTHAKKVLASLPGPRGGAVVSSPDDRFLLYTKFDSVGSELMLIEKFR